MSPSVLNPPPNAFKKLMHSAKRRLHSTSKASMPSTKCLKNLEQVWDSGLIVGTSHSTEAKRNARVAIKDGTWQINTQDWFVFTEKVLVKDPDAQLDQSWPLEVFHSHCKAWIKIPKPYTFWAFKYHCKSGKCVPLKATLTISGIPKLASFGFSPSASSSSISPPSPWFTPCMGLWETSHPQISYYLIHCPSCSGGGHPQTNVAKAMYSVPYRELEKPQKKIVDAMQRLDHKWKTNDDHTAVHTSDCMKNVCIFPNSNIDETTAVCNSCVALLWLESFQKALSAPWSEEPSKMVHMEKHYVPQNIFSIYTKVQGLQAFVESVWACLVFSLQGSLITSSQWTIHQQLWCSDLPQSFLTESSRTAKSLLALFRPTFKGMRGSWRGSPYARLHTALS